MVNSIKLDEKNPKSLLKFILGSVAFLIFLFIILNIIEIEVLELETYNSSFKREILYQNYIKSTKQLTIVKTNVSTKKNFYSEYLITKDFFLKISTNSRIFTKRFFINNQEILKNHPIETYTSITIKSKKKSLLEYIFLDAELLTKN